MIIVKKLARYRLFAARHRPTSVRVMTKKLANSLSVKWFLNRLSGINRNTYGNINSIFIT